jgi:radical SAM protein with 4Fe4S-binding SPASM domain
MSDIINNWRDLSSKRFIPLQASLELTHRCNESCEHCYLDELKDDHSRLLSLNEWFKVLEELKSGGVLYLIFIGGEAMLSPHFWPLAERAKHLGFDLSLITNGLKIKRIDVAEKLKEIGFRHVTFSLYSLNPKIHDELTNTPGSQIRTLQAIEFCRNAGLEVGINCLLTYKNIEGYFALADWCVERNLEIKVDPNVTPKFGGDLGPTRLRASKAQLFEFYLKGAQKWTRALPEAQKFQADDHVCNAAKGKCAVTPYGDLLSCIEIREPLGNLKIQSFKEAWYSKNAEKWRNIKYKDLEKLDHESGETFCEHCPGMAAHEHGNEFEVMEFSKELAILKKEVRNYVSAKSEIL